MSTNTPEMEASNEGIEIEMEASNYDRVAAGFLLLAGLLLGLILSFFNPRAALYSTGVFLFLLATCLRYNPTGWWAQYKVFGDRVDWYTNEGIFIVLWFLWITHLKADCRETPTRIEDSKVFTSDGIEVHVRRSTIVWQIFHLNLFHNIVGGKSGIARLLDDVFDQRIRRRIRDTDLITVVGLTFSEEKNFSGVMARWGVRIIRIIVSEVTPVSEAVRVALASAAREKWEASSFNSVVAQLKKPEVEGGSGMSPEQAIHHAALIMSFATEKKISISGGGGAQAAIAAFLAEQGDS